MPIPSLEATIEASTDVATELTAIDTAIAALPATPLEADLPDIVEIVAAINTAATNLKAVLDQVLATISTVRINQQ